MGTNAALVNDAYAAFGRGDIGAVLDMLTDDVEWSSPGVLPHGGGYRGKAEVGSFFAAIGANWQALPLDIESVGEVNGSVLAVLRADGTRTNGDQRSYGAVHVFDFRAGKISRFREYVALDAAI
jgi:ketosteroid isomerase-like protein